VRITVTDLDVRYGARHAVAGVSLAAEPGEILGLIGANGSGKSSIMKAIAGLQPHGGTITFGGGPRPARLGYMPQDIGGRSALTVLETVLLGRLGRLGLKVAREDIVAVGAVLEELDLTQLAPRRLSELSGGQRQLVYLAQALAGDPPVLLLDEPISALDIRHQLDVLETVRRLTIARRLSTLIVLHDLNAAARFCDRLGLMSAGTILVAGAPPAVLTPAHLATAFHIEATVMTDADGCPVVTARRSLAHQTK
jgi:iron complex transport system ATP-binding protein